MSIPPPPTLPWNAIHPKVKAAAAVAGLYIGLSMLTLWATGALSLKTAALALTGPLLPVVGAYLKSAT